MGGAVSAGQDNNELIDNLVDAGYIKNDTIQRIFRAVDRGNYYLPDHRSSAYKDSAWKCGNLHLSAPCIYSEVMEALHVEPSMSFLNLGSGTGYLSTLAGLILGPYGANHGIEQHSDVVDYAMEKLDEFLKQAKDFDEFEFCVPIFMVGNCLRLTPGGRLYDRVYCGAACPPEHENYMKHLIKIGGILVMPFNDNLLQILRTGESCWETNNVLAVTFANLVLPATDIKHESINLPDTDVLQLQDVCRCTIRQILRENILNENPGILKNVKKPVPKSRDGVTRNSNSSIYRCINSHRTVLVSRNRGQEGVYTDDDQSEEEGERDDNFVMDDDDLAWADILTLMRSRIMTPSRTDDTEDQGYGAEDEVQGHEVMGLEESEGTQVRNSDAVNGLVVDDISSTSNSSSSSIGHADTAYHTSDVPGSNLQGIPIRDVRLRSTSMNSTSTSCTSGVGTCSSVCGTPDLYAVGASHTSPGYMSTANEHRCDLPLRNREGGTQAKRQALSVMTDDSDSSENYEDACGEMNGSEVVDLNMMLEDEGMGCFPRKTRKCKAKMKAVEQETGPNFRSLMFEKVDLLPIPLALKNYLLFFRHQYST